MKIKFTSSFDKIVFKLKTWRFSKNEDGSGVDLSSDSRRIYKIRVHRRIKRFELLQELKRVV